MVPCQSLGVMMLTVVMHLVVIAATPSHSVIALFMLSCPSSFCRHWHAMATIAVEVATVAVFRFHNYNEISTTK